VKNIGIFTSALSTYL